MRGKAEEANEVALINTIIKVKKNYYDFVMGLSLTPKSRDFI